MTVWFQNRRQLQKKQSVILGSAPQPMCRQPLRAVPQLNSQATSRQPSVSSSQPSAPHTPLFLPSSRLQPNRRLELWEHLPSSPVTAATISAATSALPSPLAKKFPNIFSAQQDDSSDKENKRRKPILEWACARVAKRKRIQALEEEGDGTEDDSDLDHDTTLVDLDSRDVLKSRKNKISEVASGKKRATNSKLIAIPEKYNKSFDPDVILGASLLLTFQHSCKSST